MSTLVTARLPDDLAASLDFVAKHFERPRSFCIIKALKKYIAEQIEEIEDNEDGEISLQRINNPHRQLVSWDEAERMAAEIRSDV